MKLQEQYAFAEQRRYTTLSSLKSTMPTMPLHVSGRKQDVGGWLNSSTSRSPREAVKVIRFGLHSDTKGGLSSHPTECTPDHHGRDPGRWYTGTLVIAQRCGAERVDAPMSVNHLASPPVTTGSTWFDMPGVPFFWDSANYSGR